MKSQPANTHRTRLAATAAFSLLLAGWFTFLFLRHRCDMGPELMPLFAYFTAQLNAIQPPAEYWIDYGTLLGSVRERRLLPHEFDLDLGAREEECPRIIAALKEKVKAEGYPAYERGEWIEQKYNRLLGTDGYLHKPCFRVYDQNHEYYVDIDWYRTYTPAQVVATQSILDGKLPHLAVVAPSSVASPSPSVPTPTAFAPPPPPATTEPAVSRRRSLHSIASPVPTVAAPAATGPELALLPKRPGGLAIPSSWRAESGVNLLCNEEGIDGGDPGGCRQEDWLRPVRRQEFAEGVATMLPHQPEANLVAMYGEDWRTPHAKGYKILVCPWFPQQRGGFAALILATLTLPILLHLFALSASRRTPLKLILRGLLSTQPLPVGEEHLLLTHAKLVRKESDAESEMGDADEEAALEAGANRLPVCAAR